MLLFPRRLPIGDELTRSETVTPGFGFHWDHWMLRDVVGPQWRPEKLGKELQVGRQGANQPTTTDYTGDVINSG